VTAFILLWNPRNWEWPSDAFADAIASTGRGEKYSEPWSTGTRHHGIAVGDRAYLVRQGRSHRGLVAVGQFTSEIYWDTHWGGSDRDAPYAEIDFERVLAPADVLPVDTLVAEADGIPWAMLRGGGVEVPAEVEAKVVQLWSDHLANLDGSPSRQRNPPWAWDEIVLALDLYFRVGVQSSTHPDVIELSAILNRLPIHSFRPQADRFRNPNGVNLKLANLAHFDSDYAGTGMARGSRRDREVFNTYVNRREELALIAAEIRSLAAAGTAPIAPEPDEEEVDAAEGRILYRRHRMRERDLKIVKRKKAAVIKATGRLACEACDLDFGERYGQRGEGFIECHHTKPLASSGETLTRLDDLALLCSNCHRMVHLRRPMLSVEDLSTAITVLERDR
jgi:5-methylcytosine-specific restriction protein A